MKKEQIQEFKGMLKGFYDEHKKNKKYAAKDLMEIMSKGLVQKFIIDPQLNPSGEKIVDSEFNRIQLFIKRAIELIDKKSDDQFIVLLKHCATVFKAPAIEPSYGSLPRVIKYILTQINQPTDSMEDDEGFTHIPRI